jgi:hypothetical protein
MMPTKTINNPKTNRDAIVPTNKDNFPHRKEGKGLPKYGSQSETMIENHTRPKHRNTKS